MGQKRIIVRNLKWKEATSLSKRKMFGKMILVGFASQMLLAAPIQASTLDQLEEQELQKQAEISELESTVATKLSSINEKKAEVEALSAQIIETEAEKANTLTDIEETKAQIAARKEQLEARLLALQTSSTSTNRILMIFESESFSDFLGRILVVGQLQAADNEQIESAMEEEKKLTNLEAKLDEEVQQIKNQTAAMNAESDAMYAELGELQTILNENKEELQSILTAQTEEEQRLAEAARLEAEAAEKAAAEKRAAEEAAIAAAKTAEEEKQNTVKAAEKETPVVEPTPVEPPTQPVVEAPKEVEQPAPISKGRTLTVSATAYSRHEAGLTNFTATGIDLRLNPMVIAVDPTVIPLGTLLDVPGYGIAIAGDTGGAIKGNKIDLHMEDVARMNAFGRQTMTITILD